MTFGGKGKTFFHVKKNRTSAPVFPSPINLSHPYSRSERFTLPQAKASHCEAMLHDGCNPSLHISFPLSLFKKSEVFCRSVVAARRIASDDRRKSQRAQISPTGGWRCAKCRVELGVCTDDYGQQRTETDNTDDRPAGVQNKPYLHKPRNRHYPQNTSRLSGDSRTTGAISRVSGAPSQLPHACPATAGRQAPQQTSGEGAISRRYHEFCQGGGEGLRLRQGSAVTRWIHVLNRLSRRNAMKPEADVR